MYVHTRTLNTYMWIQHMYSIHLLLRIILRKLVLCKKALRQWSMWEGGGGGGKENSFNLQM